jgi:undecaprenyl-diphosphatase
MDIFQSIFLGILQGFGEFLPISSTAHLILAPYFFGWPDPGLSFDVALHLGTLVAVILFFWRDLADILKSGSNSILKTNYKPKTNNYEPNIFWLLLTASIPGFIFGFFLDDFAEREFRNPLLIAGMLSFVGLILFLADKYTSHKKNMKSMTIKDAAIIGISQAVAIIPGVSRSGITISAGLARGFSREQAARFSFLLSVPIIMGAVVLKLPEMFASEISVQIVAGVLAAALSGYLAIKYMLKFIQKVGYAPFFYYRVALAGIIVIYYFSKF